jgi:hypothetical protein
MSSCNAASVNCAIRPTNKGVLTSQRSCNAAERPAGPALEQLPRKQPVAPSRSLVTYDAACGAAASSSPDAPPATAAPGAHFPGRGSNRGCRTCSTTAADSPVCWRPGTPGLNNIFAALDSGNQEQKTSYNADICSAWQASSSGRKTFPLKALPGERKPEENPAGNKTQKEEKKRSWWNGGRKRSRKKTTKSNRRIYPVFRPPLSQHAKLRQQTVEAWHHMYSYVEKHGYADTADDEEFVSYVHERKSLNPASIAAHLRKMADQGLITFWGVLAVYCN